MFFNKFRCKYPQQNISNPNPIIHKKDYTSRSSGILTYSMDVKMIQFLQINQCDTPYK